MEYDTETTINIKLAAWNTEANDITLCWYYDIKD